MFDNVEDTLSFSRFQTFNFDGWSDAPDVVEPLLFYVLQRVSTEIELMAAAEGLEYRRPLKPAIRVAEAWTQVRKIVARLECDRTLHPDIGKLQTAIVCGDFDGWMQ